MRARLLKTTVFRMSLLSAIVFSLVAASALEFLYWDTASGIEQQTDARLRLESDVILERYQRSEIPELIEGVRQRNQEDGLPSIFFYRLFGPPEGGRLAGLLKTHANRFEGNRVYATLELGEVINVGAESQRYGDPVRVLVTRLPGTYYLLVGRDLNDQQSLLDRTFKTAMIAIGVTLTVALGGGALMGYGVLKRIDAVNRTAGDIISGDFSRRIPITSASDEFDELALRLNAMLERIEQLMAAMRQVTNNVAHDLRSPLTRLRNRLEVTLLEGRSAEEYRDVMERAMEDAAGLIKTFNALLSIAQVESGVRSGDWGTVDLRDVASELAELYSPVADEKGITFAVGADAPVCVSGNRQLLAQAVSNLLDNAIKYTPVGGKVALTATESGGQCAVCVSDNGPGIPEAERDRALHRFVRLDSSRSAPGNGLGLSLVRAVAQIHDAQLVLDDNHPGLRVTITIPLQSPGASRAAADASTWAAHGA